MCSMIMLSGRPDGAAVELTSNMYINNYFLVWRFQTSESRCLGQELMIRR